MPLRLDSIIKVDDDKSFAKICSKFMVQSSDNIGFANDPVSLDGNYVHRRVLIKDELSDGWAGMIVYTFKVVDGQLVLFDCDVVFSGRPVELLFDYRLSCSSEMNEYYDVIYEETGQHFQVETVNRHMVKGEVERTTRKVYLSAFPISFEVAKNMRELNDKLNFKPVKDKDGREVIGFAEDFMGVNMSEDSETNPYSTMCGKVKTVKEVAWKIGRKTYKFELLTLETGVGIMPVVMNHEIFNKPKVKVGDYLFVVAYVKADFWDENI